MVSTEQVKSEWVNKPEMQERDTWVGKWKKKEWMKED